jgi:predicted regulator of Ras-like GTPase activity (Roadblock/LC7/MglB family)
MFKEPLKAMIERTDGSIGALIMGTDGIAVEKVLTDEAQDVNLDVVAAQFTSLVRNAQHTGGDMGLGNLRELVIAFEESAVIIRLFNREYFVVLAMRPDGNLGRGRFEMRKAELELAREFIV